MENVRNEAVELMCRYSSCIGTPHLGLRELVWAPLLSGVAVCDGMSQWQWEDRVVECLSSYALFVETVAHRQSSCMGSARSVSSIAGGRALRISVPLIERHHGHSVDTTLDARLDRKPELAFCQPFEPYAGVSPTFSMSQQLISCPPFMPPLPSLLLLSTSSPPSTPP